MTYEDIALERISQEAKNPTGKLDLGGLGLKIFPDALLELTELHTLRLGLSFFQYAHFIQQTGQQPVENELYHNLHRLSDLRRLKHLHLSSLKLDDLAPLAGLTSLQSLTCYYTQISDLAPLAGLTSLQSLDCSGTQISDLAPLAGLTSLQSLSCSFNHIKDWYTVSRLAQSPTLKKLVAYGTTISGLPDEVLSQHSFDNCLDSLWAHLEDLGDVPEVLFDFKLMILGNGRIGKTQIANALTGKDFVEDADSTHGIQIASVDMAGFKGRVNIRDFGGQDIYHGTHALFMRSRSVNLLVWTPDTDNSDETVHNGMTFRNRPVRWWIDFVSTAGERKAPLIALQNQIDEVRDRGEHAAMSLAREKITFVKLHAVSAKTSQGLNTLLSYLSDAASELDPPFIGPGRVAIMAHLRALREADRKRPADEKTQRIMAFSDFKDLCRQDGRISDVPQFLSFLNNAGEVFWRQGYFNDQVILDQGWVLSAIYTVFDRQRCVEELRKMQGRFGRETLAALVWDEAGYSEQEQELFLSFMVSAGICFKLTGNGDDARFIVADFLPETTLNRDIFNCNGCSHAALKFDHLPPALMRNVISRIGSDSGLAASYWRHGLIAYDEKTRSRIMVENVVAEDWSGTITFDASGDRPDLLIAALQKTTSEEAVRLGISAHSEEPTTSLTPKEDHTPEYARDPEQADSFYVSYAWADDDNPDREKIVDDFCAKAEQRGRRIGRDKDDVQIGDSIEEFMQKLGQGDRVFICLSHKYLRSEACMAELHQIWLNARSDIAEFRKRVYLFTMDDADIWERIDRAKHARYWREKYEGEVDFVQDMGPGDMQSYRRLHSFALNVPEILRGIADTLQPRTIEDLLNYVFKG